MSEDSLLEDSSALQAVYAGEPADVIAVCEAARKTMRAGWVYQLRIVRDALAKSGKFKDWCEAVGVNYSTASNALSEAETGNTRSKRRVTAAVTAPLLSRPVRTVPTEEAARPDEPDPDGDVYARQIILALTRKQRAEVYPRIEAVRTENHCKTHTDVWMFLLAFYEQYKEERHTA